MADLTSLVLTLIPPAPITMTAHLGRAAYALLLRLIDTEEPALAQRLHDHNGPKPLTCSALIGGRRVDKDARLYKPDQPAWLRFTGLNATISAHLERLAEQPPAAVELDGQLFHVESATLDPEQHPWAGRYSYQELAAPHLLAQQPPEYRLHLNFASPTTFRIHRTGYSQPVPMPGWTFGSLLDRWNAFSPILVAEETRRYAEECVVLSRYRLRTRAVPAKGGVVQFGCVGQAQYNLLNRDKYWANLINLLADFAFFSGVGYQTAAGLGQVRREFD